MIPNDAIEAMEDEYLDAISPFLNTKLVEFTLPKLSNTVAIQYDYTDKDLEMRALTKVQGFTEELYKEAMPSYTTVNLEADNVRYTKTGVNLVYYPLYSFSYNHNGEEYNFYMNAQSGKISGDTPLDVSRMIFSIVGTSFLSLILLIVANIALSSICPMEEVMLLASVFLMSFVPSTCFKLQEKLGL